MSQNNLRCVICNKVNNEAIATDLGDYIGGNEGGSFFPDPKNPSDFICIQCKHEIDEALYEYDLMDSAKKEKELNDLIDQAILVDLEKALLDEQLE